MIGLFGYRSENYAKSLSEYGKPKFLPHSKGWILERTIPGTDCTDAIGCYPLFSCETWSKLHLDLLELQNQLISITMVPDPFGQYDESYLKQCFPDLMMPFKNHFIMDMQKPINEIVSRHHRKYARKALQNIQTEVCETPFEFLDDWINLHQHLIQKHQVKGIRAFSRRAFEQQLSLPSMVVLTAKYNDEIVGAQLWIIENKVAYGHVLAFSPTGYKLGAAYGLYWFALNYFKNKVDWCDIGGLAGMQNNENTSLGQFKQGWSTGFKTSYLCGRIFNRIKYDELVAYNQQKEGFFPAYRSVY